MLQLGSFQFSINTAAYDKLQDTASYKWPSMDVLGSHPKSQFTGVGERTVSLQGHINPLSRGGFKQVEAIRTEAGKGEPLLLVDGRGNVLGRWCVLSISDSQSLFMNDGLPRRQDFTLKMKYFGE